MFTTEAQRHRGEDDTEIARTFLLCNLCASVVPIQEHKRRITRITDRLFLGLT